MKLLEVSGLAKRYGSRQVVNGVSFDVDAGEIVGLLGPNGAGKTTSFRMTCGMVKPDRGQVLLDGVNVTDWPMHRRAREGGLGYLPQQSSVFGKLTVEQNLLATMQLLGRSGSQRRQESNKLLEEFGLGHIRSTISSQVSGGERRRLEIARCLVSHPKMIMLDEPFAGIDPITVQGIQEIIRQLADRGLGILITDHAAREILQITERTYVISEGEVLCSGTPRDVANHPEVRRKYLGAIDSFEPSPRPQKVPSQAEPTDSLAATRPPGSPTPPVTERVEVPKAAISRPPHARPAVESESRSSEQTNEFVPTKFMTSVPQAFFQGLQDATPVVFPRHEPPTELPSAAIVDTAENATSATASGLPEPTPLVPQFAPHNRRFFPQPKTIRQG
ncbi:MAG: LPS export ABC transporter ATP-binding protein [Planctomycetaceae bacterium]|nr:LPS export ABC transporter ATP-binding protein [Planctomycetaceae bacterium]